MTKHFVTFYSPGTFVAETREEPVDTWNVDVAREMAKLVTERYGATPYGFRFSSRTRGESDLDSKVSETSGMYYLHGRIDTLEDVEARNDPKEQILLSNMRCNGYKRVVTNTKGYRWTQPLEDRDVVLETA